MARTVIVEDIQGPIGPGDATRAVRTTTASDDPSFSSISETGRLLRLNLVEQRITNLLLAQFIDQRIDLDQLRAALEQEI